MEKKIAEGTQRECFATEYLKIAEKENFDENQKFFTGIIPPFPFLQTQASLSLPGSPYSPHLRLLRVTFPGIPSLHPLLSLSCFSGSCKYLTHALQREHYWKPAQIPRVCR